MSTLLSPIALRMPPVIDRGYAARFAKELAARFASGEHVCLDGGDVVQIGQVGLQLLLSAARTADVAGCGFEVEHESAELRAAIDLAGLRPALAKAGMV